MSLTPIQVEHVQAYVDRVYDDMQADSLGEVPLDHLFEALCETIVEHNESYKMENLTTEWHKSDKDAESFVSDKFDQVITDELERFIPIQHKNLWVDAAVHGLYELSNKHNYQDIPEKFKD